MGESVDVIDYTLLRKKGILQRAQGSPVSSSPSPSSTNPLASFLPASSPTASSPAAPGGFFGFMDAPASPASPPSSSLDPASLSALQIKVDDLDYKLGKLTEQLALLEAKLGSLGGSSS